MLLENGNADIVSHNDNYVSIGATQKSSVASYDASRLHKQIPDEAFSPSWTSARQLGRVADNQQQLLPTMRSWRQSIREQKRILKKYSTSARLSHMGNGWRQQDSSRDENNYGFISYDGDYSSEQFAGVGEKDSNDSPR